jgi:hypothetical protein
MRLLAGVTVAFGLAVSLVAQQVYAPGDGVSLPIVVKQVRAGYTEKAMNARIEGNVALKQWEFKPGLKDGEPVAVRVRVIISFRLT